MSYEVYNALTSSRTAPLSYNTHIITTHCFLAFFWFLAVLLVLAWF